MLVAKLTDVRLLKVIRFENYVNYAGSKTKPFREQSDTLFENYVNYAGSKTRFCSHFVREQFENYVNYAGSKTLFTSATSNVCLRTM